MVLWSRCHGTSDDTEIAGRWEFIETSQYRVHRGENRKKHKSNSGCKSTEDKSKWERKKDKNSKTIMHKRTKSKNYNTQKLDWG